MLTEKDYCDYETCVALKKLGFNDPTHFYYGGDGKYITIHGYWRPELIQRFSLYEAQRFLREEKNLHLEITYSPSCWTGKIYDLKEWDYIKGFTFFKSFEEALHILIKEAVKILKQNETIHE